MKNKILVEVSARHIHISRKHLEKLFGKGYKLTKLKDLSQPGMFSCKETVILKSGDKKFENVRIIGPVREDTQVEISKTDAYSLNLDAPLRVSGNLGGSESAVLIGSKGRIELDEGVIISKRHLHVSPKEAKKIEVNDGEEISVKIDGERSLIFNNVRVRVDEDYSLAMHIDIDEGNAANINQKTKGELV